MSFLARVGDAQIDRVEELVLPTSVRWMLPDIERPAADACDGWMRPHYRNDDGRLVQSVHALLLRVDGLVVLVDSGVGNGKDRTGGIPAFHMLDLPWLERFAALGVQPGEVDMVLSTHLHTDHCGWNTIERGRKWGPTFPHARYLIVDREWEHWSRAAAGDALVARLIEDSLQPVFDAGQVALVAADHRVSESIALVPSHGHSPGHVTIEVTSGGERAALTGDVMHTPLQCAFPDLPPALDRDPEPARRARHAVLERYAETGTLVIGAHFPGPPGRIRRDGAAYRYEAVEA